MKVAVIQKVSGDLKMHIKDLIDNKNGTVLFLLSTMPVERIIGEITTFKPDEIHTNDKGLENLLLRHFSHPLVFM